MSFTERHKRVGIVTNMPGGYDPSQPYVATNVCGRDECVQKALKWVAGETNMTASVVLDEEWS